VWHLAHANEAFALHLEAALALGDAALVDADIASVEQGLVQEGMPAGNLARYLGAYGGLRRRSLTSGARRSWSGCEGCGQVAGRVGEWGKRLESLLKETMKCGLLLRGEPADREGAVGRVGRGGPRGHCAEPRATAGQGAGERSAGRAVGRA